MYNDSQLCRHHGKADREAGTRARRSIGTQWSAVIERFWVQHEPSATLFDAKDMVTLELSDGPVHRWKLSPWKFECRVSVHSQRSTGVSMKQKKVLLDPSTNTRIEARIQVEIPMRKLKGRSKLRNRNPRENTFGNEMKCICRKSGDVTCILWSPTANVLPGLTLAKVNSSWLIADEWFGDTRQDGHHGNTLIRRSGSWLRNERVFFSVWKKQCLGTK